MEIQAALDAADETDSFLGVTDVVFDKAADQGYDTLSEAEKTVYCLDQFLKEAENGGLIQFLYHEAGARAADTLLSLERIHSKGSVAVFRELIEYFDNGVPTDDDARIDACEKLEIDYADELSALEERFYEVNENLVALTLSYVSSNIKAFR